MEGVLIGALLLYLNMASLIVSWWTQLAPWMYHVFLNTMPSVICMGLQLV